MGHPCSVFSLLCVVFASSAAGLEDDGLSQNLIENEGAVNVGFVDENEVRHQPWIYLSVPHHGVASLLDILDPTTSAHSAFVSVGEPIQSYLPVPLYAPMANYDNGAVTLLMLPERCLGDFNEDGRVNLHDVQGFIHAFLSQDPAGDITGDGIFDVRDHILFLHLTTIPCISAW